MLRQGCLFDRSKTEALPEGPGTLHGNQGHDAAEAEGPRRLLREAEQPPPEPLPRNSDGEVVDVEAVGSIGKPPRLLVERRRGGEGPGMREDVSQDGARGGGDGDEAAGGEEREPVREDLEAFEQGFLVHFRLNFHHAGKIGGGRRPKYRRRRGGRFRKRFRPIRGRHRHIQVGAWIGVDDAGLGEKLNEAKALLSAARMAESVGTEHAWKRCRQCHAKRR
mmetsp:Transcript_27334/g.62739  ORF Transcript_27334/g.62739 Transcript_27334/m.62739 type:complete len:221 (+) Transcript_27334:696-1358(+)